MCWLKQVLASFFSNNLFAHKKSLVCGHRLRVIWATRHKRHQQWRVAIGAVPTPQEAPLWKTLRRHGSAVDHGRSRKANMRMAAQERARDARGSQERESEMREEAQKREHEECERKLVRHARDTRAREVGEKRASRSARGEANATRTRSKRKKREQRGRERRATKLGFLLRPADADGEGSRHAVGELMHGHRLVLAVLHGDAPPRDLGCSPGCCVRAKNVRLAFSRLLPHDGQTPPTSLAFFGREKPVIFPTTPKPPSSSTMTRHLLNVMSCFNLRSALRR